MKKVTACPLCGEQEVFDACRFNTETIEMTAPALTAAQEQRIAEIAFEHYHYVYRTTLEDIEQAIRAALADPELVPQWQDIATAPKGELIDIWIPHANGNGIRWAGCYYDQICDEWRTVGPSGHMVSVKARAVSHWYRIHSPPQVSDD